MAVSSAIESTRVNASRPESAIPRLRVCYVIESGTDVRTVEGLADRFELTLVARRMLDGVEISQPTDREFKFVLGPSSRARFALFAAKFLRTHSSQFDYILVQGYGLTALAANLTSKMTAIPTAMVIVSPVEAYYRCRKTNPQPGKPYRAWELGLLEILARLNAKLARRYLVPSNHLGDTVRAHGTKAPIDLVPIYGVDLSLFQPRSRAHSALKNERGLPASGQVIFFSSRIAPEKDANAMLTALGDSARARTRPLVVASQRRLRGFQSRSRAYRSCASIDRDRRGASSSRTPDGLSGERYMRSGQPRRRARILADRSDGVRNPGRRVRSRWIEGDRGRRPHRMVISGRRRERAREVHRGNTRQSR